jgi:catalase-peroxidase
VKVSLAGLIVLGGCATVEKASNEISDLATGEPKWTATPVDLIVVPNSQLRALAEVFASDDGLEKFVNDFVAASVKVMESDSYTLR